MGLSYYLVQLSGKGGCASRQGTGVAASVHASGHGLLILLQVRPNLHTGAL